MIDPNYEHENDTGQESELAEELHWVDPSAFLFTTGEDERVADTLMLATSDAPQRRYVLHRTGYRRNAAEQRKALNQS
jgi:hypothetical protein